MRLKIILANASAVLLVAVLSFIVVRLRLTALDDTGAAKNEIALSAKSAAARLQLQLLRAERWLSENGTNDVVRDRLSNPGLDDKGRRAKLTESLNALQRSAGDARGTFENAPDIVALVDKSGKAMGRSEDPQTYNGEDFGGAYPALAAALTAGHSGSDLWLATKFNHKHLASWAPVRDKDGAVLGAVVALWSLTDKRINEIVGPSAALVVVDGGATKVWAKGDQAAALGLAGDLEGSGKDAVLSAIKNGAESVATANGLAEGLAVLGSVGDGQRSAIGVARRIATIGNVNELLWPIGAVALLGFMVVAVAGFILGNYVTEPVGRMEETLLQVINGNSNARIELEHAELGGLAFRINQLLNTVLGVEEDDTDDEGRPSTAPAREHFQEALQVDRAAAGPDISMLASEPEAAYYGRIYREYIEAKQANGEKVDGITEEVFVNRIKGMEREQAAKLGKPVRYAVARRENQVVLQPVPLG
jgi:hypothetical protein